MKRTLWVLIHQGQPDRVGYYEDLKKYGDDLDIKEMECNACFDYELITVEEYQQVLMADIRRSLREYEISMSNLFKEFQSYVERI